MTKFFMPDWNDTVDPGFDFQADEFTPDRDVSKDVYAHEIFERMPYSGILISRAVAEKSETRYQNLVDVGSREFYRLPDEMEIFGDCGAFSYVNEDEPRYETEDVLEYYDAIGVDYGVSVDHLVVNTIYVVETAREELEDGSVIEKQRKRKKQMTDEERQRRIHLTLENADDFLRLHNQRGYEFTPVGVAQGWNSTAYAESVEQLLKMGYKYIALGGLARSPSSSILEILRAVEKAKVKCTNVDPHEVRLHLFGVAKRDLLSEFPKYGVASIDSASYLRKAWLRSGQNYLGADGKWYSAIRVPQSHHYRVRNYIEENGKSLEKAETKEEFVLQELQRYSEEGLRSGEVKRLLDAIIEYDAYMLRDGDDGRSLRNKGVSYEKYKRSLEARPWEDCPCEVCQNLGVHVLVFRGTNRNKRRGFHNTWTFYQMLKSEG